MKPRPTISSSIAQVCMILSDHDIRAPSESELFSDITNRIFSVSPKICINLTQIRTSVGPEILCPVKYDYFTLCLITIYHLSVKLHLSYLSIVVRTPPLRSPISGRTPKRRLITPIPGQHLHCNILTLFWFITLDKHWPFLGLAFLRMKFFFFSLSIFGSQTVGRAPWWDINPLKEGWKDQWSKTMLMNVIFILEK